MAHNGASGEGDDIPRTESALVAFEKTMQSINRESVRYGGHAGAQPWVDDDGNVIWSRHRITVAKVVRSHTFDACMGVVIMLNIAIMVYESNTDASCYPEYENMLSECQAHSDNNPIIGMLNNVFLALYTIEAAARVFVDQRSYIFNAWNQLDAFLVCVGWVSIVVQNFVNVSFLRVLRLSRLLRAMRVLMSIRELYLLMTGFVTSLRAIFFGSVCLFCALSLWGIITVQVVHPVNASIFYDGCERCSRGFESVQSAILTLFQQTVAGDSWGTISLPVIEKAPWTGLILPAVFITIGLGVMNLILAVIVERAAEARENDVETKLREKDAERRKNMMELAKLCHEIDYDESGKLSLDNFMEGMANSKQFAKLLQILDLEQSDIEMIFQVLDVDQSGDVSYFDFCDAVNRASKRDVQMMGSLNKFSIAGVKAVLERDIKVKLDYQTALLHQIIEVASKHTSILLGLGINGGASADARPAFLDHTSKEQKHHASNGVHVEAKEPNNSLTHLNGLDTTSEHSARTPLQDFHQSIHELVNQVGAQTDAISQAEKHLKTLQKSLAITLEDSSQQSPVERSQNTHLCDCLSEIQSKMSEGLVTECSLLERKKQIQSWLIEKIYQEEIPRMMRIVEPSKDAGMAETSQGPAAVGQLQPTALSVNGDYHAVRV